ncbi:MAG: sodium:proton antiporter [Desulfarculus sp.]|nr:MAG: sodium:proton antiporter [Desulfarculus sp.]
MKILGSILVVACWILLAVGATDFPRWGDPHSPAALHVSPRYLEKGLAETQTPNIVTAVLADYRGYDTMYETTVVFAAGVSCFLLLRFFRRQAPPHALYRHKPSGTVVAIQRGYRLKGPHPDLMPIDLDWAPHDPIVELASRLLIPLIQIFALYVVAHGHYSPGGGFQGGVILGASLILLAISQDLRAAQARLGERSNALLSAMGVLIYVGVGAVALGLGGNFLDYGALAGLMGVDPVHARSLGILFVEIGVAIAVMATMFFIYRNVASAGALDEGL